MNIGASAADLGLTVLLLVPGLLGPILLLGVAVLATRILRLPLVFAVIFTVVALGALLLAGSLVLDSAGRVVSGRVEQHIERVLLRRQGDWRYEHTVSLRYSVGSAAPLAEHPSPDDSATTLKLTPMQFDRLYEGGPAELRVLPLFRSLALVRLADTSTRDYIPWTWLGGGLVLMLLFVLVRRLPTSRAGVAVLVVVGLAAALGILGGRTYNQWRTAEDLGARPLRATAEIIAVDRISQVDPLPCRPGSGSNCTRRGTLYDVIRPYDIVQVQFAPEGTAGPVIAVDAIDAGSADVRPGLRVEIAYAATEPRTATLFGATRTHYWLNPLGLGAMLALPVILLAALAFWGLMRLRKRMRSWVSRQS